MTTLDLARLLDLLAVTYVIGATFWVFFVQSPQLMAWMGRDNFVPVQMRLTKLLFTSLIGVLAVMLAASAWHSALASCAVVSVAIALAAVLANRLALLPRAMRAGGQRRKETFGKDIKAVSGTAEFLTEGLGGNSKFWHVSIVALVAVMLGASLVHSAQVFIL